MHAFIPYGTQNIDEEDINEVVSVLKSSFISSGPKINEFENAFAEYVGCKYCVAVSNGTAALHCACMALGLKPGDEVITTPLSFVATANAILYCGAKPVFVDINKETLNIDETLIEEKITKNTKAIIPVHFAGRPCNMDKIKKIAQAHNLKIIEDAAHALGAKYKNNYVGSIGDMTTFSFHPVKHITTGEGGMIATNDEHLYKKLQIIRNHGITRDKTLFECNNDNCGGWYYEQICLGYNYRITDFQSALGISQLKKMPANLARRKEIVNKYLQGLKNIKEISLPKISKTQQSSWHLFIIKVNHNKLNRKKVFDRLRACNIGVNVHYIPIYYQPYYKKLGYKKGLCPNVENIYEDIITLPIHSKMTNCDVDYVIECLKNIILELKNEK